MMFDSNIMPKANTNLCLEDYNWIVLMCNGLNEANEPFLWKSSLSKLI